jgi:pyroglutamyl-peptidase
LVGNHKDCDGNIIENGILKEGSLSYYYSTFPYELLNISFLDQNISNEYSENAGRYVCNSLLYLTLDYLVDTNIKCGFMHLPIINNIDNYKNALNDFVNKIKEIN